MQSNKQDLPPVARHLVPYLRRAEELEKHSPVASFYCRVYVAEQLNLILRNSGNAKDLEALIRAQISKAEELKKNSPVKFTKENFEFFCSGVLDGAEAEYRRGNVSAASLHAFFCASLFFDVLTQFGPLLETFIEKRRFAKWRATEIKKQLDGRKKDESSPAEASSNFDGSSQEPTESASAPAMPPSDAEQDSSATSLEVSAEKIVLAQKFAQQALSALGFHDIDTARQFLQAALDALSK